jgi:uncharacterized damage-inducible protein DinB
MPIAQTPWLEHRFNFDFPVGHMPMVIERLRGTPARLEERLLPLAREILTSRPPDGWSVQEHAGHLLTVEELFIGRLDDYERRVEVLRAADMRNAATRAAAFNDLPMEEILQAFRQRRGEFVRRLRGYSTGEAERAILHPRLGMPMRLIDNAFFAAEHDDHHLARMTALLEG